jgi:predicted phage tail protein
MGYFDEHGNEVTGLIPEDQAKTMVEEAKQAAIEEAAKIKAEAEIKATEMQTQVQTLQQQIDAAKAAPAGGDGQQSEADKENNLAALRKKLEETQAASAAEREQFAERLSAIEGDRVNQAISAVASGNKDLEEKIRYNYDKVLSGVKATTAEEISAKIQNAVKLSLDAKTPNPMDFVAPGSAPQGGTGVPKGSQVGKEFSAVEKAVGNNLGISDADRAKYGNDPRLINMNTK